MHRLRENTISKYEILRVESYPHFIHNEAADILEAMILEIAFPIVLGF